MLAILALVLGLVNFCLLFLLRQKPEVNDAPKEPGDYLRVTKTNNTHQGCGGIVLQYVRWRLNQNRWKKLRPYFHCPRCGRSGGNINSLTGTGNDKQRESSKSEAEIVDSQTSQAVQEQRAEAKQEETHGHQLDGR